MAAEGHEAALPSSGDYIIHHLKHAQNGKQIDIVDFSYVNLDSIFFSVLLGVLGCFFLWRAAKSATSGVPGRFQAAVEILVEIVADQAKGIVHNANSRKLVAPLALTVFVWIFLMNAMDLLPVDLLPWAWQNITGDHHAYLRVVPTADLSMAMGLSIGVLITCLIYNVKMKGAGGWAHELVSAPFGDKVALYPINFAMQMVEFVAKTVSHGMRLFGNMYAGELIFLLIALMGGAWASVGPVGGVLLAAGHVIAGFIWAAFHLIIITLQAFVFMMLTLVYIGQAHDAH
ncbi:F0F1 ATP synthase subunit A [Roseateles paludis]|jgi:F-type H+-transporting ATPase subunit a|uniref:ATP synthase subunit a n=1 Tax=Roseateles paludis TaxID=3145238 RepID=A0ABV0FW18_9BURK